MPLPEYTGLLGTLYNWQTIIAGVVAVGAAWYGGYKAIRAAGIQAKATTDAAQSQLEDAARPICVLMPYDGIDPWQRRDKLLAVTDVSPETPGFGQLELRCCLRNIGRGPALNVRFQIKILEGEGYASPSWEVSPLYAGELRGDEKNPIRIPIQFTDQFNKLDYEMLTGRQWQLVLFYTDVFGNEFSSVHHKTPRRLDKLYSAQPISEPQPWVTLSKGEPD